jgi:hypothetical protein
MDDVTEAMLAGAGAKAAWGYGGAKAAGFAGIGFIMAAAVVMAMTSPPTRREFLVALIATLAFSIGGGGAVISYFHLQAWADDMFGMMAILGLAFICGLPGWIIVRAGFIFAEKNKDKDIGHWVAVIKGWLGK